MNLTEKDKEFLVILRRLMEEKELVIDLQFNGMKRMILKKNYGDMVERTFGMTRQGVRWRFSRIFNSIYTSAYETIYMVESLFGTRLRSMALEIVKERVELRKNNQKISKINQCRRQIKGSRHGKAVIEM
jgi:hypothetical protein